MHIFLFLVILVHSAINFSNGTQVKDSISSIFEGLGYSPVCVSNALTSCEQSNKPDFSKEILDTLREVNKNLQHHHKSPKFGVRNCAELLKHGDTESGVKIVFPYDCGREKPVTVFCDQETDGGGWTVFQNRVALPVREDFYRTWVEYALGFGNITGEFWLGLDHIHALVSSTLMELRVDLEDFDGIKRSAKYGTFYVGDANSKYTLNAKRYSGDAGDAITSDSTNGNLNGMKFSTYDQDNDMWDKNCAVSFRGAWWYRACHLSNLNGYPYEGKHESFADGVNWKTFQGYNYSLKKASLKLRPSFRY